MCGAHGPASEGVHRNVCVVGWVLKPHFGVAGGCFGPAAFVKALGESILRSGGISPPARNWLSPASSNPDITAAQEGGWSWGLSPPSDSRDTGEGQAREPSWEQSAASGRATTSLELQVVAMGNVRHIQHTLVLRWAIVGRTTLAVARRGGSRAPGGGAAECLGAAPSRAPSALRARMRPRMRALLGLGRNYAFPMHKIHRRDRASAPVG